MLRAFLSARINYRLTLCAAAVYCSREDIIPPISSRALTYENQLLNMPLAPGRVGSLSDEEREKLREMWAATMKLFGKAQSSELDRVESEVEHHQSSSSSRNESSTAVASAIEPKKRGRLARMLTRNNSAASDVGSVNSTDTLPAKQQPPDASMAASTNDDLSNSLSSLDLDDKYGQSAEFKKALASNTPQQLHDSFWSMVKADHPDALLLRFLRARKWDVAKALIMMVSTMRWRGPIECGGMDVEGIMQKGELGFLEAGDDEFMLQLRKGKSIIHGTDLEGRPVCIVRSRFHRPAEQSQETMEKYTVHIMETCRLMLRGPVDTATIVFDLTNIEAKYMDLGPVRFIIKCFEAHYPESLGTACVYGAPWFFRPVWAVVKGLLDPVVAQKIKFANSQDELAELLPRAEIIKELGGEREWEYTYIEPSKEENAKMTDTATRDRLLADRAKIVEKYEEATRKWALSRDHHDDKAILQQRDTLAKELESDYWRLDPYVRAKTHYDRVGYIEHDGKYNPRASFKESEKSDA
ncbi:phosphatidylinositol transfer protein csr1 [Savitreella phatthalungensis]